MEHRSIVERAKKHDTVMKNVAKILYILLSFWLRFWANIGLPYSKSAIMSTRKSLECKTKAWRIKFQQYRTLAAVKTLYSSLNLDPDTAKFSYFYPCRLAKAKTAHVRLSSCQTSASSHQVQCDSILLCLAV